MKKTGFSIFTIRKLSENEESGHPGFLISMIEL